MSTAFESDIFSILSAHLERHGFRTESYDGCGVGLVALVMRSRDDQERARTTLRVKGDRVSLKRWDNAGGIQTRIDLELAAPALLDQLLEWVQDNL